MNTTITVLLTVAVALLIVLTCIQSKKIGEIDNVLDDINEHVADAGATASTNKIFVEKKIEQFDEDITRHQVDYYDQMESIINLLEEICKDIGRLDEEQAQDHRDLVDIRSRYILYREPAPEQEDQTDGND